MKRKTTALLALLLAALMLLAACKPTSGKPEETKAPGSETTGETAADTSAETSGNETKPAETTGEKEPGETGAETKAPETRPSETEPAETEPAETEPKETEPKETEPSDPGSDPQPSAEDLAAAVIKTMKAQKEYYSETKIHMNFKTQGLDTESYIQSEHAYADLGTADAFLYQSAYSDIEIPSMNYVQERGLWEAYSHGTHYTIYLLPNSEISEWVREEAAFPEIDFSDDDVTEFFDCKKIEAKADAEGNLLFTLSGYSSPDFTEAGSDIGSRVGAKVLDAKVNLYTDPQFRVTMIKVTYVFEDLGDDTPVVSFEVIFTDYDNVTPTDLMDLDPALYNEAITNDEVIDVLAMFIERLKADRNAIALEIDQNVTSGDETAHYGESSAAIYQRTADGLSISCYTVFGENGENEGEIYYENGTRTVVQNGQTVDLSWTEEEAEAFLSGAMMPVQVGIPDIASKDADGWVCFVYDSIEEKDVKNMMSKLSATPAKSCLTVYFEIKDGAIASVEYWIWAEGYSGQTKVTLEMDYGVLFDNYEFFEG